MFISFIGPWAGYVDENKIAKPTEVSYKMTLTITSIVP